MRSCAHGTGDFSHGHLCRGIAETLDVTLVFREPVSDLQAKGDGFRVDAVRAADLRRVAEFMRAEVENFSEHGPSPGACSVVASPSPKRKTRECGCLTEFPNTP